MAQNNSFFSDLIANGEFRVNEKGHAILNGEFLLMVPPPVILKHQEDLVEEIGEEKAKSMMVDTGRYQIEQALRRYKERYGLDEISKEKIVDYGNNILKVLGWGEVQIEEISKDKALVKVENPLLPSVYRNRRDKLSEEPICHYLRGMMSEAVSAIIEEEVLLEETQCAATGGEVCVFEMPKD